MTGWVVESSCDDASKTCVHGNMDQECNGVPDGGRYEGMEDGPGVVCLSVNGLPTKMSPCPAFEEAGTEDNFEAEDVSDASISPVFYGIFLPLLAAVYFVDL